MAFNSGTFWAWSFLFEKVWITDCISLVDIELLRFSVSCVNFGKLYFSRSLFLICQFIGIKLFKVLSYYFNACVICDNASFIPDIGYLWYLFYFFISLAVKLSILSFSENQIFSIVCFLIPLYYVFHFIYFALLFRVS